MNFKFFRQLLVGLVFLLMTTQSFAKEDGFIDIGNFLKSPLATQKTQKLAKSPSAVCSRINDDQLKMNCYRIARNHYYSQPALNFCDQLKNARPTVRCMRMVGDQAILDGGYLAVINDDNEALNCINNVINSYFENAALKFCDQLKLASATTYCMGISANQRVQSNAARACARINDDHQANSCLEVIVGRYFSNRHVQECDSLNSASATIQCFKY